MTFEILKKGKKPCQICRELVEMRHAQKYCNKCVEAAYTMVRIRGYRKRQKVWNNMSAEEQLKRMDMAAKKILDDPDKIRRTK